MNVETSLHVWGNFSAGLLYASIFFFVVKDMLIPAGIRTPFSISIAAIFVLITASFWISGFLEPAWASSSAEFLWLFFASLPGLFFFFLAWRNNFFFSFLEIKTSRDRFDKLKEEFLSVASHELRTPLSVINGFAEILVREKLGPLNDEQKRRVRKILMQGQRLNRIIDELLDLSRIKRGKIECRKDVFDLVPVLKACLDDHQIVCEQQTLELIDEIPDVLPDVKGDLERVTQVTVNLLNNAIKYTDPGGRVSVSASFDERSQEVMVSVTDTGIGLEPRDQENVFREFFRVPHPGKKYSGSGLGLAIVKQLVEAQGGRVGVVSEGLGRGSRFYFTIPASGSAPAV